MSLKTELDKVFAELDKVVAEMESHRLGCVMCKDALALNAKSPNALCTTGGVLLGRVDDAVAAQEKMVKEYHDSGHPPL